LCLIWLVPLAKMALVARRKDMMNLRFRY